MEQDTLTLFILLSSLHYLSLLIKFHIFNWNFLIKWNNFTGIQLSWLAIIIGG